MKVTIIIREPISIKEFMDWYCDREIKRKFTESLAFIIRASANLTGLRRREGVHVPNLYHNNWFLPFFPPFCSLFFENYIIYNLINDKMDVSRFRTFAKTSLCKKRILLCNFDDNKFAAISHTCKQVIYNVNIVLQQKIIEIMNEPKI